ncbi:oligopeptide transporter subunit; ATP-binding component of ABC superfamily [uncultured Alphaproteobacteria bacterium]|uniref:Oligopeptide transporter subunit ATP-binding component of ABC superfamily n=1 Tax=uncultured Alphaproteobacteria bacterium TaxID=91750 RepID=A0A212JHY4_9PROT|nr:oligopeptide transporter subunit; ATP-binding component of ABC superfamily [uncultured Alphaproteobacteria bacterium]
MPVPSPPPRPRMLEIDSLKVQFPVRVQRRWTTIKAVDGVSLSLAKGDTLGVVGESGSGKSTLGLAVLRLAPVASGRIALDGADLADPSVETTLRRKVQVVFQDPHSALNPRMTILRAVAEPLVIHNVLSGAALEARVAELLETVGLPRQFLYRYPHELSGGQKQRVCIARAIALKPELLILDEPTSALDVSVQAQILEVLKSLQREFDLTYLFISHNLAVIRAVCRRVAVMYLGRIVEEGETERVFSAPQHPYTRALLQAVPVPEAGQPRRSGALKGDVPSPVDPPPGCVFHTRCPVAVAGLCDREPPVPRVLADGRAVACHLAPA